MAQGKNGYFFGTLGDQEYNSDNRIAVIKGDASKSSDVIIIMENEIGGPNNIKNGEKKNEYIEKKENGLTIKYTYENEGKDLKITWDYKKPEVKKVVEKKEKVGDDTTKKVNDNVKEDSDIVKKVKAAMKKLNYVIYTKPYILNIVGIRSKTRVANKFDDKLVVFYTDEKGIEVFKEYDKFTTDPGNKSLIEKCPTGNLDEKELRKQGKDYNKKNNLASLDGTAILVEGQYIDTYKKDKHQGKYFALCQRLRTVKVYRDANKDSILNLDNSKIDEGMFGINIHRAASDKTSPVVEDWSAGCQVFANFKDFNEFMNSFVDIQISKGEKIPFTYTLINEEIL